MSIVAFPPKDIHCGAVGLHAVDDRKTVEVVMGETSVGLLGRGAGSVDGHMIAPQLYVSIVVGYRPQAILAERREGMGHRTKRINGDETK